MFNELTVGEMIFYLVCFVALTVLIFCIVDFNIHLQDVEHQAFLLEKAKGVGTYVNLK